MQYETIEKGGEGRSLEKGQSASSPDHPPDQQHHQKNVSRDGPRKPFYKKTSFIVTVVILLIIASVVGYNLYVEYTAATNLEFDVKGAGRPDAGPESVDIPIEKIFHNPSSFDTPPINAVYDIYVGEEYIGDGTLPLGVVSAGEKKIDEQEVTVYYEDVSEALAGRLREGDFTITIKGEARADILYESIMVTREFEAKYNF